MAFHGNDETPAEGELCVIHTTDGHLHVAEWSKGKWVDVRSGAEFDQAHVYKWRPDQHKVDRDFN